MSSFATLPFEAQLERIERSVGSGDAAELLREAGALTDPEPLARLLDALAAAGELTARLPLAMEVLAGLPDPALSHVFASADVGSALDARLREVAKVALETWPATRPNALAFLVRWLRRRDPDAYAALRDRATRETAGPPGDGRWLLFVPGAELARLRGDDGWGPQVERTLESAIDALARAPKSISQVNAERLLARRVYADPGHFLFELLQNADDAGASRWSARIEPTRVVIENDGAPFSFLDLVGVLSIGQTTKAARQIGFFGVGFKSVYEVCERPRIHSGAFDVEIAHVSIPRIIERPASAKEAATALVLPLREGVDVEALARRAEGIPPETLMTLPHLRSVRIGALDRSRSGWTESRAVDRTTLAHEGTDETRVYWHAEREVRFEGEREEGRPSASRVLVAAQMGAEQTPTARAHPTLFAFLPTAERTGLRVLVHARFDVTLDRERLELGSAWNEALLGAAGEALADLALRLVAADRSPLEVLSAPSELAPGCAPLAHAARGMLAQAPCLPSAAGSWVAPTGARIAAAPLARALADLDLGAGARMLAPLDNRATEVARWLGSEAFTDTDLVAVLAANLEANTPPPAWLSPAVLAALGEAAVDDGSLRALPLLGDAAGHLLRARDATVATGAWARLYTGLRAVAPEAVIEALPRSLARRLKVARFDPKTIVEDLIGPLGEALIAREGRLLDALDEADDATLGALRATRVLRDEEGARTSIDDGLVRPADWLTTVAPSLVGSIPLVARDLVASHPALVARWVPTFGLPELADALDAGLTLDDDARRRLASVLDARGGVMGRDLARRLARRPLFADHTGRLRPLLGPGRAMVGGDPALVEALPSWPWLADASRPFLRALEVPRVDATSVAAALIGDGPDVPDAARVGVFSWLARRADELPNARIDALAAAAIWLGQDLKPRPLDALRRGTGGGAIESWFEAVGSRAVAHEATLELLHALRLDSRLPASDHGAAVRDLVASGRAPDVERALLCEVLEEAARVLPPAALRPLAALPLFADSRGTLRPVAPWSRADEHACHRPGAFRAALSSGALPLIADADERLLGATLAIVGPPEATAHDLVARAHDLIASPDALLEALASHSGELTDEERAALSALPLLTSSAGARRRSRELCDPAPFIAALGADTTASLAMGSSWLSDAAKARVSQLRLTTRSASDVLRDVIAPQLVAGERLDAQAGPWRDRSALWALCDLHRELGVSPRGVALCLTADERVVVGPLFAASASVRATLAALPLVSQLADAQWAEGPVDVLLEPLPARRVAEALRQACPQERPRAEHPVIGDVNALYAWLREARSEIVGDPAARAALGGASVLPSQRGTLRAPRDLVLDASLPDLGLDWGLAADVPDDVARWLSGLFELDLAARRTLVEHVLDGLDAAAEDDDVPRGSELVRFLAGALGAGNVDDETLSQRARRSKTRARLKVPVHGGGWEKPRFAWAPSDEVAEHVHELTDALPPRITLPDIDAPSRRLLAACGARSDLDDKTIEALLDGDGLRPGLAARRALARYVAVRTLEQPSRLERWRLTERAWVPDRGDGLHVPSELLWPDELADELFGDDPSRFPDAELCFDLPPETATRLGFARASTLSLHEVALRIKDREARVALLEWLEEGLKAGRFDAAKVKRSLRARILLRDDDGIARRPRELARTGAQELFGRWRGNLGAATRVPRLADALEIPTRPTAAMIAAFLTEAGRALEEMSEGERDELALRLPGCFERLGELAESGSSARLTDDAAVATLRAGRVTVVTLADPALRMLEPVDLADALPDDTAARLLDPLPAFDRSPALVRLLWAAGVPDLLSVFKPLEAVPGPDREDLFEAGEELRVALATVLKGAVGERARVVAGLAARGVIELAGGTEYRASPGIEASAELDAVVLEQTLWLTADALRDPTLLAPALARDPQRRAATARWLAEGRWESAPKRVTRRGEKSASEPRPSESLWSRLKRVFSGDDEPDEHEETGEPVGATREGRPKAKRKRNVDGRVGEEFFRPGGDLGPQLEGTDGWLEDRRVAPDFGFAFSPPRLPAPWLYAPKLVATRFDRRGQRWRPAPLPRPTARRHEVGGLSLRGVLPRGDAQLPIPMYGRLVELKVDGDEGRAVRGPGGGVVLRLERRSEVRARVSLGAVPNLDVAVAADAPTALESFVPDAELPDEVHAFLADLAEEAPPIERALSLRDFVRARYRYDPSYLEDASVGRWLARVTRGRANAHVAALHAAGDGEHLGAGVCYELNVLTCELLRRAGVPAAIATGWVLDGGALSEPDHLWAIALLRDDAGEPVWVPVDASTTRDGRPLRVPRRPAGRFKKPRGKKHKPPRAPRWDIGRGPPSEKARRTRKSRRPPRAELRRVLRYLERASDRPLTPEQRTALEEALGDRALAAGLLERIIGD